MGRNPNDWFTHGAQQREVGGGVTSDEQRSSTTADMRMHSVEKARRVLPSEFMFPDAEDFPSEFAEEAVHFFVAGLVALNLLPPEGGVGLGFGAVPGTAVPEAAVHKHRGLALGLLGRQ